MTNRELILRRIATLSNLALWHVYEDIVQAEPHFPLPNPCEGCRERMLDECTDGAVCDARIVAWMEAEAAP